MAIIDSVLSYYKLDESSGNAIDVHGSDNLTISGGITHSATGKLPTADPKGFNFDGVNAYIYNTGVSLIGKSVTFWGKPDTGSTYGWCISNEASSSVSNRYHIEAVNVGGKLQLQSRNRNGNASSGSYNYKYLDTDEDYEAWHFVYIEVGSDPNVRPNVFVNGTFYEDADWAIYGTSGTLSAIGTGICFGRRDVNTSILYFDGTMDEIAVFDGALTSAQVLKIYDSGNGLAYPLPEQSTAQSSSIDYNNSTITQAKLTTTFSSGSASLIEMTADGTNWEDVTNGTLHTFSNPGTDLRWRITAESATLTNVEVTNYH